MGSHTDFKSLEEITGEDLKAALVQVHDDFGFAAAGQQAVCFIELPDGTHAQVFVGITTDEDDFIY